MDNSQESGDYVTGPQPSVEELRSTQRFAMLIRTAKLVCENGEYLCIVRDVSATGVRLRLFHSAPPDPHMALELANGDLYFIERVWEARDHAGFRFATPIDVNAFMDESGPWPRRPMRLRFHIPAMVTADGVTSGVTIHDLSQHGARIESARFLAVGQQVKLESQGLPPLHASVCWRSSPDYGLVFQQTFSFDALARLAQALQPLAKQPQQTSASATGPNLPAMAPRADSVKSESRSPLTICVVTSLFAENRSPLFRAMHS